MLAVCLIQLQAFQNPMVDNVHYWNKAHLPIINQAITVKPGLTLLLILNHTPCP